MRCVEHAFEPEGRSVRIYAHPLGEGGERACFTYVTSGLRELGQREIALTVLRAGSASLEEAPLAPRSADRSSSGPDV